MKKMPRKICNQESNITIQNQQKLISDMNAEIFKLKEIIDNLPGDVYWKDENGVWSGVNLTGSKTLQKMGLIVDKNDVVGKTDYELFSKETADLFRKHDLEVIKQKKELTIEEKNKLPSGEEVVHLSTKRPLYDENGKINGLVGNTIDITYLKKIELDLKTAKEAAEAANHAKTEFIANMSHDIRTPLSGVVGLGGIVEKEISDMSIKSKVHDMVKSAEELLNMLNEILDVVSIDNISASDIQLEAFNLKHLVQTIIDLEKSSVDLKNIKLLQNIDNEIPEMLIGDHKKIHHILLNLVGNAIKFTQKGQIIIDVKLSKRIKNKVELIFSVADTGIGIPKESLDKVFELFYKVTPSYKGLDKGHGVGLHIVKTYTELLGGKIYIESELDKGSKFSFNLTLKTSDKNVKPSNIHALKKESEAKLQVSVHEQVAGIRHILLIEDNHIGRMVAKTIIEETKCAVYDVPDAEIGLELAKSNNFDLIFTDIGLPGMSGIEFAEQFRNYEEQNNKTPIPIIALTGHAEGKLHTECINAGINDVIIKPIRPEIINDIFAKLFMQDSNQPQSKPISNTELDLPSDDSKLFEIAKEMIFDIEKAKSIIGQNNIDLLMSLLKDTIKSVVPDELPKLKEAHAAQDWQTIADITHKLKGGFLSIGLNRAATACKYLERYHKTGKTALLEKLYQQVLDTIEITINKLMPFIK